MWILRIVNDSKTQRKVIHKVTLRYQVFYFFLFSIFFFCQVTFIQSLLLFEVFLDYLTSCKLLGIWHFIAYGFLQVLYVPSYMLPGIL